MYNIRIKGLIRPKQCLRSALLPFEVTSIDHLQQHLPPQVIMKSPSASG
jgi:hypothetical protein